MDARGSKIGEILGVRGDRVEVALGGARDVWGFVDIGGRTRELPATGLLTGPRRTIGMPMVALPGFEERQARASR